MKQGKSHTDTNNKAREKKLFIALALSLFVHAGLAAAAGAMLTREKPRTMRFEVDLKLLAPPSLEPKESEAMKEKSPEPEKPQKKPEPKPVKKPKPKPKPRPAPKPKPNPLKKPVEQPVEKTAEKQKSARLAKDTAREKTKGAEQAGGARTVKRDIIAEYEKILFHEISRHRRYPRISRMKQQEGTALVSFTVLGSGEVKGVRVKQSSGFTRLDDAAEEAVSKAAPFPPPPQSPFRASIPIHFMLR